MLCLFVKFFCEIFRVAVRIVIGVIDVGGFICILVISVVVYKRFIVYIGVFRFIFVVIGCKFVWVVVMDIGVWKVFIDVEFILCFWLF